LQSCEEFKNDVLTTIWTLLINDRMMKTQILDMDITQTKILLM
jgi:hypothetical protein